MCKWAHSRCKQYLHRNLNNIYCIWQQTIISPNWSFQAWNSRSSREIVAQLATARAAATNSSFILTDTRAEKAERSLVTCRKPHRLRLFHFSFASQKPWRWMSHALYHSINRISSCSSFISNSFLVSFSLHQCTCSTGSVCVSCHVAAYLPLCRCVEKFEGYPPVCRWCRAVLQRPSYIADCSYDLQYVQSGGCQPLIKRMRKGSQSIIEMGELSIRSLHDAILLGNIRVMNFFLNHRRHDQLLSSCFRITVTLERNTTWCLHVKNHSWDFVFSPVLSDSSHIVMGNPLTKTKVKPTITLYMCKRVPSPIIFSWNWTN